MGARTANRSTTKDPPKRNITQEDNPTPMPKLPKRASAVGRKESWSATYNTKLPRQVRLLCAQHKERNLSGMHEIKVQDPSREIDQRALPVVLTISSSTDAQLST